MVSAKISTIFNVHVCGYSVIIYYVLCKCKIQISVFLKELIDLSFFFLFYKLLISLYSWTKKVF